MRIALCFSGQPRTWEQCYPTWMKLAKGLKKKLQADSVDIFCHAWNFNTTPNAALAHLGDPNRPKDLDDFLTVKSSLLDADERKRFSECLTPQRLVFETEKSSKRKFVDTNERAEQHINEHGEPVLAWVASQF